MNRWVTLIGLVVTVASFIATLFPPTHRAAIVAGLVAAIATAVGKALWPEEFNRTRERGDENRHN